MTNLNLNQICDQIEQEAVQQLKPSTSRFNPRFVMAALLGIGLFGLAIGSADLKVDKQVTFNTKLGQRTQPEWLAPQDAKILKVEQPSGKVRGVGWLIGIGAFGILWHVSGKELKWQKFKGKIQINWTENQIKQRGIVAELKAMAEVKQEASRLEMQTNLNQAEVDYQFHQAIGWTPPPENEFSQPFLPYGKPGTYDEINNPSDKIEDTQTEVNRFDYVRGFVSSTCLAWGNQGGGKSWIVRYFVKEKILLGYRVIVFDPNSNQTSWRGVELYNSYEDIERMMRWYVSEVMGRYKKFCASELTEEEWRADLWKDGKAISIICEEATTYADFIEDKKLLGMFVKVANTLSRKQEMPVCFVAHNNTQHCLGEIKGLGRLIARMQQIQMIATTEKGKTQPVASGKAIIKIDGSNQWVEVDVPYISEKITDFRGFLPSGNEQKAVSNQSPETVGKLPGQADPEPGNPDGMQVTALEPSESDSQSSLIEAQLKLVLAEASPPVFSKEFPLKEHDQKVSLAKQLIALNLGKEKTIFLLWGVRPGGRNHNTVYAEARAMLDRLIKGDEV